MKGLDLQARLGAMNLDASARRDGDHQDAFSSGRNPDFGPADQVHHTASGISTTVMATREGQRASSSSREGSLKMNRHRSLTAVRPTRWLNAIGEERRPPATSRRAPRRRPATKEDETVESSSLLVTHAWAVGSSVIGPPLGPHNVPTSLSPTDRIDPVRTLYI
jgi:hypothetical protein